MLSLTYSYLKTFCLTCWWVFLFALLCFMIFEQGMKRRDRDHIKLSQHLSELQLEKKKALFLHEDLLLQVNSQSDPAWIELILMRGLGLSPEGQIKVFFTNNNDSQK